METGQNISFETISMLLSNVEPVLVWVLILTASIFINILAIVAWHKLRNDYLTKSEFISIITHKLRTPLTHIKWASENLAKTKLTNDQDDQVKYIRTANEKLVELTDLLVTISTTEKSDTLYRYEIMDVSEIARETLENVLGQIDSRNIKITSNLVSDLMAKVDTPRIRFVMQAFIENAIHYGGLQPTIEISTSRDSDKITFRVTDHGIGMSKDTLPFVFHKFYRGKDARKADTEGMGIGLFMAKKIIKRHKGKIGVESKGLNKGSTFHFSIPAAKAK